MISVRFLYDLGSYQQLGLHCLFCDLLRAALFAQFYILDC